MYALITGASSGIGKEIAHELAERGFDLIVAARRAERLEQIKESLQEQYACKVIVLPCDLSNPSDCEYLVMSCRSYDIRMVVNCAGFGIAKNVMDYELKIDQEMIATNLLAVHTLTKAFACLMRKGRIVNIASTAGYQPGPGMATYGATKAYVISFSRAMNYELKKQKSRVRVVTCCPGPVESEFDQVAGAVRKSNAFSMSAKRCAQIIVEQTLRGKELIIPGAGNRMLKTVVRFLPENLVLKMEYKIQSDKRS